VVVERKRGPVWYAQYRPSSGRQVQRALGPAWSGRGRPPAGYFTKRLAEDWLRDKLLEEAQRAASAPVVDTGTTFAEAAEEYLRYAEEDRGCKPSTIRGYRSQLKAHFSHAHFNLSGSAGGAESDR
jgi:integrase